MGGWSSPSSHFISKFHIHFSLFKILCSLNAAAKFEQLPWSLQTCCFQYLFYFSLHGSAPHVSSSKPGTDARGNLEPKLGFKIWMDMMPWAWFPFPLISQKFTDPANKFGIWWVYSETSSSRYNECFQELETNLCHHWIPSSPMYNPYPCIICMDILKVWSRLELKSMYYIADDTNAFGLSSGEKWLFWLYCAIYSPPVEDLEIWE